MYEFNRFIENSKAFMFKYLENRQINTVVIHAGINDILRDCI